LLHDRVFITARWQLIGGPCFTAYEDSPVYREQEVVKHHLEVLCGTLQDRENRLLKNQNDPAVIDDYQSEFFRFRVGPILTEARDEGLDMSGIEKLTVIDIGNVKRSDWAKYYHEVRVECQELADQLPK
jgi:hypothetical protein